jgi:hypothetical protein
MAATKNSNTAGTVTKVEEKDSSTGRVVEKIILQEAAKPDYLRYEARHILNDSKNNAKNIKTFLSPKKSLSLFGKSYDNKGFVITFKASTFETDDPDLIEFLQNHPQYEVAFFEGKYPKSVLDQIERDHKMLTRDPDEYK